MVTRQLQRAKRLRGTIRYPTFAPGDEVRVKAGVGDVKRRNAMSTYSATGIIRRCCERSKNTYYLTWITRGLNGESAGQPSERAYSASNLLLAPGGQRGIRQPDSEGALGSDVDNVLDGDGTDISDDYDKPDGAEDKPATPPSVLPLPTTVPGPALINHNSTAMNCNTAGDSESNHSDTSSGAASASPNSDTPPRSQQVHSRARKRDINRKKTAARTRGVSAFRPANQRLAAVYTVPPPQPSHIGVHVSLPAKRFGLQWAVHTFGEQHAYMWFTAQVTSYDQATKMYICSGFQGDTTTYDFTETEFNVYNKKWQLLSYPETGTCVRASRKQLQVGETPCKSKLVAAAAVPPADLVDGDLQQVSDAGPDNKETTPARTSRKRVRSPASYVEGTRYNACNYT